MADKSTYEELEERVKELEKEAFGLRRVERDLRIFKTAVASSINAIGITNLEGKLIYVNDSYVKMWGYNSKDEILGRLLPEFWKEDGVFKTIQGLSEKGVASGEDVGKRKDGSLFFVQFAASIFKDEAGNPSFMFGSFFDITERKKAEAALRESEENFRFLAENMVDIIWIIDRNFQTTYVSPSVENVLGFTPEERKRQPLEEMITPESLQKIQSLFLEELQRNGEGTVDPDRSVIIEVEYYHKKGSIVWVENIVKAIRDPGGAIVGMHGVSRDINERKQAEAALKEREVELARKNLRLEELSSALKILLEKRDQDKMELEDKILININELILPYVEKLKKADLSDKQEVFADILQANLEDIVSPFARKLKSKYLGFTPTELKVANLVKQGLSTKEIADLLNSSPETIFGHRKSMRKKLKLTEKKSNLRTHLLSLKNG